MPIPENKYDLAVAYRVCHYPCAGQNKPPIFADNKFKLVELCLRSFKSSISDLRVKLFVVMTAPDEYETLFRTIWPVEDLQIIRCGKIGNAGSFQMQLDILTNQSDADIVYVAEDDYFYSESKFSNAIQFLSSNPDVDFISPYDHPDNYSLPFQRSEKSRSGWQTRTSTTLTFLSRKSTLQQCRAVFHSKGGISNTDTAYWMALNKNIIFSLRLFLIAVIKYRYWAACYAIAWIYHWRQILFGRRFNLWIPSPSIATHMARSLEGVGVNWNKLFRMSENK